MNFRGNRSWTKFICDFSQIPAAHKTKKGTRTSKGSHPRLPTVTNAVEFRSSPPPPSCCSAGATVDRHYIPPPSQSATIALLPLVSLFKFLLGLNSSHRIPASGFVGGDKWWWGLPTTATTTSSGCTIASLLPSSQYKGDRRGKKEQGLGFVWDFSNQQKRKRDGVRLEWFYGGRICSGSRWSLVVE
ncbi:unnamed protein product [Lactuca saligna]|uniref:Uncharacterized protein n=1 Tax=Lactuca saligna TaxID=75948 RepID=A0AA36E315_LACSI|nr:unnamed protein product [Lactuca saligna]